MKKTRPVVLTSISVLTIAAACWLGVTPAGLAKPKKTESPQQQQNAVVRPAPDIAWLGAGGARQSIKKFRGQPVVVLVAPGPDNGEFQKQARLIEKRYLDISARKIVFIAAFSGTAEHPQPASSIPFALAADGAGAAATFGVANGKFACIVIGPDGNVDLQSERVEPAQRILDVVNNSHAPQAAERKGQGS
ncbi:MAG: hypothetical protein JO295_02705 [Verrucomicrobia bacterium]|nr:hypothetical protein [Verrucomicrobiota bacterium]